MGRAAAAAAWTSDWRPQHSPELSRLANDSADFICMYLNLALGDSAVFISYLGPCSCQTGDTGVAASKLSLNKSFISDWMMNQFSPHLFYAVLIRPLLSSPMTLSPRKLKSQDPPVSHYRAPPISIFFPTQPRSCPAVACFCDIRPSVSHNRPLWVC